MKRISYPLIKDISVSYGLLKVFDNYPRTLGAMYAGTQLAVLGRYERAADADVTFAGLQGSQEIVLRQTLTFPSPGENHPFVPRMWASAKIDHLLDEIAMYGENDELITNVKQLGKKYGIITPYTSMLVLEPEELTDIIYEDKTLKTPGEFRLWQISPIRSNNHIVLCYSVPKLSNAMRILLRIFDARGRLVKTLVDEFTIGGNFKVVWNSRDRAGQAAGAGCYIAILEIGAFRQMIKLQFMR